MKQKIYKLCSYILIMKINKLGLGFLVIRILLIVLVSVISVQENVINAQQDEDEKLLKDFGLSVTEYKDQQFNDQQLDVIENNAHVYVTEDATKDLGI